LAHAQRLEQRLRPEMLVDVDGRELLREAVH
jgi:hypothetical protein